MAKSTFNLSTINDDIIVLKLPILFRIVSLFVATLLTLALVIPEGPTQNLWIPILIIIITILASLYQEQWIFNRKEKIVINAVGFLFFTIKRKYAFDRIIALHITGKKSYMEPRRFGALQKSGVKMSISIADDIYKMIDLTTNKADIEIMEKKAEHISEFCNFQLIND